MSEFFEFPYFEVFQQDQNIRFRVKSKRFNIASLPYIVYFIPEVIKNRYVSFFQLQVLLQT